MSDNSPTSDRSRWVVPIVVAGITAIGAVIAAAAPHLFGSGDDAVPPTIDTIPTVSDGVSSTGRPTSSKQTSAPPATAYSGQGMIRHSDPEIDLDSLPDGTGGDHVVDLVHAGRALITSNSSQIALLDRAQLPTSEVCRSALDEHGTDTIAVAQIETGFSLCIRTTAGRTGAVTLTLVRKYDEPLRLGVVDFSYLIWDAAPQ